MIATTSTDTCLRLHPAEGATQPELWAAIGSVSREFADGNVYLERHSVLALRNVRDVESARRALAGAALIHLDHGGEERSEDHGTNHSENHSHLATGRALADTPAEADLPIGWLDGHTEEGRVDLGAGLHRGVLPAAHAELISALDVSITITPWRGLIFHDIAEGDAEVVLRVLAPRGFIFDVNSPLLHDD